MPDGRVIEFLDAQWGTDDGTEPPGTVPVVVTASVDGKVATVRVLLTAEQTLAVVRALYVAHTLGEPPDGSLMVASGDGRRESWLVRLDQGPRQKTGDWWTAAPIDLRPIRWQDIQAGQYERLIPASELERVLRGG